MEKKYSVKKVFQACLLFFMLITTNAFSQVGIGTTTPDASSILDVSSTTKGMLAPRMTTEQRAAIVSPADGLMVYDTDLKSFYHYNSSLTLWNVLNSGGNGRSKFKRIKSTDVLATVLSAEKTAGGSTKYLLDANTLYEINGIINVDLPIELNNAYIVGMDAGEDKLVKASGDLFTGTTGGSVKILTLTATSGNVFNVIGTGSITSGTQTQSLVLRDCIVASSSNIGKIENFALIFVSIVQYLANTNGIVYKDINKVLLSNAAWFGNNSGTYETFQGTFGLVEKSGGFSEVNGAVVGLDVSSNPTITGDAVIESTVFTGTLTSGLYVKGYTVGNYTGYNFDNRWAVRCAGVPTEGDASATGFLYDSNNTTSTRTTATAQNTDYKVITNATTVSNLYRVKSDVSGRLTYTGKKTRTFQVNASISFAEVSGGSNATYVYYIAKISTNGTTVVPLPETETYIDTNSGFVQSFPVTGTVSLNSNESIEVHVKRINTGTKIYLDVHSLNLSMK
ncbi:hypothetical protein ACM55G_03975 [Flavobacterium sp. LB3P122]|uniref:hypothetical protein n=1 Tax=Flavobacterium algoriphilum TaxID=3398738 RepID=UPI003A85D8C0